MRLLRSLEPRSVRLRSSRPFAVNTGQCEATTDKNQRVVQSHFDPFS